LQNLRPHESSRWPVAKRAAQGVLETSKAADDDLADQHERRQQTEHADEGAAAASAAISLSE
jgi:hypothetical protein